MSDIRFTSFPRTEPPPPFIADVVAAFRENEAAINTIQLDKGLKSNEVLAVLRGKLMTLGFEVERGKKATEKIKRPVFFGEDGRPELQYEVDAYHPKFRCGLEIEAGRALMGNAVYRDLIQALVMVNVDHLVLAFPLTYKYETNKKPAVSQDYVNTVAVANALYGHSRITMHYTLTVLGY